AAAFGLHPFEKPVRAFPRQIRGLPHRARHAKPPSRPCWTGTSWTSCILKSNEYPLCRTVKNPSRASIRCRRRIIRSVPVGVNRDPCDPTPADDDLVACPFENLPEEVHGLLVIINEQNPGHSSIRATPVSLPHPARRRIGPGRQS